MTQLGTQIASTIHDRTAVQWLREGRIGKITHAYLCSNRPGAVKDYRLEGPRPAVGQEPPPSLAWNLWLGTAPVRPYAPDIYHPTKWRAWQDFGTGWSGDIGCHIFDAVWKGLGLHAPADGLGRGAGIVEGLARAPRRHLAAGRPHHLDVPRQREDRGRRARAGVVRRRILSRPSTSASSIRQDLKEYPPESSMLIGTEGSLLIPLGTPPQLLPEDKFSSIQRPKLPPRNHYHHFVDACLGGEKTESHFAQTGPMAEAILLGTVAIRVPGQKLEWDSPRLKVTNSAEANHYLQRRYRDGWHLARLLIKIRPLRRPCHRP